ncbi:hypothetical protein N7461_001844 [Penicillium sp. DV-2018c]|nr:hypothetical protein N7461_001844 [Penicillium sp. DV-2018c]
MAEVGSTQPDEILPCPAATNRVPENTLVKEQWKHHPPYDMRTQSDFGPVKWRGKCLCGEVTYSLNREKPLDAKYCHCRVCQRAHGAPFQWAAIFDKHDMSFDNGASGLAFYSSTHHTQEYNLPTKVSCATCRTPIMDEGRNMCLIFPGLIELDGSEEERRQKREIFKPTCHMFYEQRMLDIPDGLPKWSGMNDSSDRLDDQGKRIADGK